MENPLGLPDRTNEAAGAYAKACIDVAGECETPVVDIWKKMQQISDWQRICLRYISQLQFTHTQKLYFLVVSHLILIFKSYFGRLVTIMTYIISPNHATTYVEDRAHDIRFLFFCFYQ